MSKFKIQNSKFKIKPNAKFQISNLISCVLVFVILMSGCAVINEEVKGFAGVSTRALERARKSAIIKVCNYDYFSCYTKTLDSLKKIGAYIYAKDIKKHMIAFYVSETDTTPVGIFFKEVAKDITQLEVSSQSSFAKEFIAGKLFSALDE